MELSEIRDFSNELSGMLDGVVHDQDDAVTLLTVALLCDGHVLIEGVPGTAKTLLARAFAASLSLAFNRIQFTPDLMPGDLLGTNLFDFQTSTFRLTKGPIFTEVLLADEINRTPPKTQAALLQAMQERAVTIDGITHELGGTFLVVATQNPIEQQGTYPLPEAQLDRFLFKILIDYPSRDAERRMVHTHGTSTMTVDPAARGVVARWGPEFLAAARECVSRVKLHDDTIDYIVDLVRATRESSALLCGASPRAVNMMAVACRAHAALDGRDFVIPDDIKRLADPLLRHRLVLSPASEIEGTTAERVVAEILDRVAAPR